MLFYTWSLRVLRHSDGRQKQRNATGHDFSGVTWVVMGKIDFAANNSFKKEEGLHLEGM